MARVRRRRCDRPRAEGDRAAGSTEHDPRAPRVPGDGGDRLRLAGLGCGPGWSRSGGDGCPTHGGSCEPPSPPARAAFARDRGRMDRHRGRPSAVDRAGRDANRRGGHIATRASAGTSPARSPSTWRSAAASTSCSCSGSRSNRRSAEEAPRRGAGCEPRGGDPRDRLVGLTLYVPARRRGLRWRRLGPLRVGRTSAAAAGADLGRDRTGVGGQPRLADLRAHRIARAPSRPCSPTSRSRSTCRSRWRWSGSCCAARRSRSAPTASRTRPGNGPGHASSGSPRS